MLNQKLVSRIEKHNTELATLSQQQISPGEKHNTEISRLHQAFNTDIENLRRVKDRLLNEKQRLLMERNLRDGQDSVPGISLLP